MFKLVFWSSIILKQQSLRINWTHNRNWLSTGFFHNVLSLLFTKVNLFCISFCIHWKSRLRHRGICSVGRNSHSFLVVEFVKWDESKYHWEDIEYCELWFISSQQNLKPKSKKHYIHNNSYSNYNIGYPIHSVFLHQKDSCTKKRNTCSHFSLFKSIEESFLIRLYPNLNKEDSH